MTRILLAAGALLLSTAAAVAQHGAADGTWPVYGGDPGSTKYSSLDRIGLENVASLRVAWRWSSPDNALAAADRRLTPFFYEATPLYANGLLFTSTSLGFACALDPATGEPRWQYDTKAYENGRPTNLGFVSRGLAYWPGDNGRIFMATADAYLHCIDAASGAPVESFGAKGKVDLTANMRRPVSRRSYAVTSPPLVFKNLVIVGSSIFDGPTRREMPPGDVRAFDARTGEVVWTFHNPPLDGEFGHDTWRDGSADYTGNANVWTIMSADQELGYVYLPFGTPTNDWYGGQRPGDGLFGETLVCVDGATGKRVWHFQTTHHGVWDYDLCAAPALLDVTIDGEPRKIVMQVTKQGFVFVFDRITGEPIWPIEERAVPPSIAEGEQLSPTQPFPTKPAPFDRQGLTVDDVIDFTPELRAEALAMLEEYNYGPLYTPPMEGKPTLYIPGWNGGGNWCGLAADPETGWIYVPSITAAIAVELVRPDAARSNFTFVGRTMLTVDGPQGLPFMKPPYGRITAMDMTTGEHRWQSVHGQGPTDHPALAGLALPPLGEARRGYPLVTKTLLFVGQEAGGKLGEGVGPATEPNFRAFDKKTGAALWETTLPYHPTAAPMTFLHEGEQYIVTAIGGLTNPAELIALALP